MATRGLTIDEILIQLPETPRRIATLTTGVAPAKLQASAAPAEWSANNVLAHLRACAHVWGNHILTIITEDMPSWGAVSPRSWIEMTDYVQLPFAPSLRSFTKQRAVLLKALGPLPRKDWSRAALVSGADIRAHHPVLRRAPRSP
jgi:hypothetical protein